MFHFVQDVEVVTVTANLDEVQSYRAAIASLQKQAASIAPICGSINVPFHLCGAPDSIPHSLSTPITPRRYIPSSRPPYCV